MLTHDLALALGMTTAELGARMSEAELLQWARYRAERMFPQRRLEYGLAMIALKIAQSFGGAGNLRLDDFLLDRRIDAPVDTPDRVLEALGGGRVFRLGQKHKRGG